MKLVKSSALNLSLKGSAGSFKVGAKNNHKNFEVKYLLTHVGLNFEEGSDEQLLKELAPVREIFDFRSLDFDEIMQRDIDDSRVSNELIPYILDDSSAEFVKFFPPIVIFALPIKSDANKPDDFYPTVTSKTEKINDLESGVEDWLITQSGGIGKEVFKFEQPIVDNEPVLHDLVKLSFNTSKCKLVIVDGQHRAMALLALYRNIKDDWSDARRKPFESYYQEWTPDYIRSFDLKEIKLPMIICTIPALDEQYKNACGEYDLKKASRTIFLTLNKTARKVSRSRNLLLDDSDLISSFMRGVLSKIKNGDKNFTSDTPLEIHNIELDQNGDRQVISSPMAFTGVSHLYYIIEHLMLNSGDVNGIRKREGRFSTRTTGSYITGALSRLDCENILGRDAIDSITRNIFTRKDEYELSNVFNEKYGSIILKTFANFKPFADYAQATQTIKDVTGKHADVHINPMLFDGQGIAKVFSDHKDSLTNKLKEGYFKHDVPKIEEFKKGLEQTSLNYSNSISQFNKELVKKYLSNFKTSIYCNKSDDMKIYDHSLSVINNLFKNIFSTVAFQSGLICGFYAEYEKASTDYDGHIKLDLADSFDEYLEQIGTFFKPKNFSKMKVLIDLFMGESTGDDFSELKIIEGSNNTFRSIVYPGEMSPDEWPKYKYLFMEIWRPTDTEFELFLEKERDICRKQIIKSLYDRSVREYSKEKSVHIDDIEIEYKKEIFNQSYDLFKSMLKKINRASNLSKSEFKMTIFN